MDTGKAVVKVPCVIALDPSTGAATIGCDLGRLLKALGFPEVQVALGEAVMQDVEAAAAVPSGVGGEGA